MSRRLLMAGGGSPVVVPTDPGDGGGGTPGGGGVGFPTTTDPTILALRPTGLRTLGTTTATPGDDIGSRVTELSDTVAAQLETAYGAEGPEHSAVLSLPPGEYTGGFGTGRWLAIVGTTGNPADVIIHSDTTAADGVMHPYSPVYVEGVTLKGSWNATLDQSPKYAAHISGSSRTTFANVVFDVTDAHISSAADSTWGCAGTVGMDGSPGTTLIFYSCTFLDVAGESRLGMNLHGGPSGDYGSTIAFIDCTAPKGVGYSWGNGSSTVGANDSLYVIGGTIGGPIVTTTKVDVYTDLPNTVTGAETVTRSTTTWPIPSEHGLTQLWLDYFYPSALTTPGTTEAKATVTDTAPMSLTSGRTYYCPIPVTEALHLNRFGIYVRSGAGAAWGWKPQPDVGVYYGSPEPAHLPGRAAGEDLRQAISAGDSLPNGKMLSAYYYSWVVYPATSMAGNYIWFSFKVASAAGVTVDGSAQLPGLHDCYYSDDDGVTIVQAAAGSPFPLAHAAQVK